MKTINSTEGYRLNQALVITDLASSRRAADKIIKEGQVYLDKNKILDLNRKIRQDQLSLLRVGTQIAKVSGPTVVLFNKPKGYVCSHQKTDHGDIIFSLLPKTFKHYKMSGRLDKNSSGLVVLSNQAQALDGLERTIKIYEVTLDKGISKLEQEQMLKGLRIKGKVYQMTKISPITTKNYRIELISGYYHQIKVMFDHFGITVRSIHRISVGPYHQDMLMGKRFKLVKSRLL
jgi:pseudouridine synthase